MKRIGEVQLDAIVKAVIWNTGFPLILKPPWVGLGGGWQVVTEDGATVARGTPTEVAYELRTWERGWAMARKYHHKAKHGTVQHRRGHLLPNDEEVTD